MGLGLLTISPESQDEFDLVRLMAPFISLRGLAELRAGDVKTAFTTCMRAYALIHARMQAPGQRLWWELRYFPDEPDVLFERLVDAAWRDTPLNAQDRKQALDRIGWHPEWSDITQDVRRVVGAQDCFRAAGDTPPENAIERVFRTVARPWVLAKSADMLTLVDGLVGKPPYATKDRYQTFVNGPARSAPLTRGLMESAFTLNELYWSRVFRADLTRVVFALKDYKREHGAYPESLDVLNPPPTPESLLVPDTGTPCEYRSDGQTFTIISPLKRADSTKLLWSAME